jgi:hypothetical protein
MKAAEQRQMVAHGASRGFDVVMRFKPRQGRKNRCVEFLPPLPGLVSLIPKNPRLTPWAMIFRLSEAGKPNTHACV